ncbi:hypothetical protein PFISCL1PPCAC_15367 [Pristionchus fissidentatus]|uniref:G protein-coupled receptor n=1 Tax=Pristionchus fissidentatus TaxID=1538716 RepID=A0AAV5W012_9BILA|nr:hypothetical protein PFISCL1PPCAC_15348 [Pristionchus fissidentatus]GMT24070.1 hypothetical protein PFISCL1PPCAC_15367 [Pristionchus fissidentatus]
MSGLELVRFVVQIGVIGERGRGRSSILVVNGVHLTTRFQLSDSVVFRVVGHVGRRCLIDWFLRRRSTVVITEMSRRACSSRMGRRTHVSIGTLTDYLLCSLAVLQSRRFVVSLYPPHHSREHYTDSLSNKSPLLLFSGSREH